MNYEKMWKELKETIENTINNNDFNRKNKTDKLIIPLLNHILDIMKTIELKEIKKQKKGN